MMVQPQGGLEGGDQLGPFVAVGERAGADQPAPPGELPAAGAGKHPAPFHVDPGVDEGRWQVLGEVLQVIGQVLPGRGAVVQVVDLVDFPTVRVPNLVLTWDFTSRAGQRRASGCRISQRLPPGWRSWARQEGGWVVVAAPGPNWAPDATGGLCGRCRVCCVEVRDGSEGLLGLPRHTGVGRAEAAAVPRRFRIGSAERTEPAAEVFHQAVAGHVKVAERVVARRVERSDERHDEGSVHSGGVEDREQLTELAGLLGFVTNVVAVEPWRCAVL